VHTQSTWILSILSSTSCHPSIDTKQETRYETHTNRDGGRGDVMRLRTGRLLYKWRKMRKRVKRKQKEKRGRRRVKRGLYSIENGHAHMPCPTGCFFRTSFPFRPWQANANNIRALQQSDHRLLPVFSSPPLLSTVIVTLDYRRQSTVLNRIHRVLDQAFS